MDGTLSLLPRVCAILNAVLLETMFLVVRSDGKSWDGFGWAEQGRAFLTIAQATRSLHEEGEDLEKTTVLSEVGN